MKRVHDIHNPAIGVFVRYQAADGEIHNGQVVEFLPGILARYRISDGSVFCYAEGDRLMKMSKAPITTTLEHASHNVGHALRDMEIARLRRSNKVLGIVAVILTVIVVGLLGNIAQLMGYLL